MSGGKARTRGSNVEPKHHLQQQTRQTVLRPGRALRRVCWQEFQQLLQGLVQRGRQCGGDLSMTSRDQRRCASPAAAAGITVGVAAILRRWEQAPHAPGAAPA